MIEYLKMDVLKGKPFAVDVCFSFKDSNISKELYEFLESRLNNYYIYLDNSDWKISVKTDLDESSETSKIYLDITVPQTSIPKDEVETTSKDILKHKELFKKFYEEEKEIFNQMKLNKD